MVDLAELREPEEVYLAAIGNREPLACRILDEKPFSNWERRALAAYLRGELKSPVRKRGQKQLPYLKGTDAQVREYILIGAVFEYHYTMESVKKETGTTHKMKSKVAESIATSNGIDVETLIHRIDRQKKLTPKKNIGDTPPHVVRRFHLWLHRTGRLENYLPYIDSTAFSVAMGKISCGKPSKNDPEK
jgi:hypothetical protein